MRRAGDGQAIAATAAPSKVASAPNAPEVSAPNVSSTSFVPASLKEPASESPVQSMLPAVAEEKPTSTLSVFVVEKTTVKVSASTLVHEYSASALEE